MLRSDTKKEQKILPPDPSPDMRTLDKVSRRSVSGQEAFDILKACHSGPTEGHYGA
ncbi:hypothetical protein Tco_0141143, partial [Tanacetum coccineum]